MNDVSVSARAVHRGRTVLACGALGLAVAAAYLPALRGEFLVWDDPTYVTMNSHVHGLSREAVGWAFTTFYAGNWHPLTWLSHALDYQVYGDDARGHHLTSLGFHVVNSILVFLVFQQMTGAFWRSLLLAALFGLHPLRVESVAWVSERKDVLCAFFWLLTMAAHARFARRSTRFSYVLVLVSYAMGLMSKPMIVSLPVVLLLLDYWPLQRLSWKTVREKVPLLALGLALSIVTMVAQSGEGAVAIDPIPIIARLENAVVVCVRYLGLAVSPRDLSPWYSHPAVEGPPISTLVLGGAGVVVVGCSIFAWALRRRKPFVPVGWFWYLTTLLPIIGLIQVGRQGMADRYTYLPLIGIFLIIAWGLGELPIWQKPLVRAAGAVVITILLTALGAGTWQQTKVWHDSMSLWTYTVRVNPHAYIGHSALGGLFAAQGRIDDAVREYRRAARLRPEDSSAYRRLGQLAVRQGKLTRAVAYYEKVIALRQATAEDHNGLALVLLRLGRPIVARRHLEQAVALRPGFAEAHDNLGRALMAEGRVRDAIVEFEAALQLNPGLASARRNLAAALQQVQQLDTPAAP